MALHKRVSPDRNLLSFSNTAKPRPSLLALGVPDSKDFSDIFDDAVAMERKESQTKLLVPPSGPSVDASYELSKPGHDLDSDGSHDGKKRAQSEERSMGPCMRCLTKQIRVCDTI
jgi:hypothetical protein